MASKAFPQQLVRGRVVQSTSHLRKPRPTPGAEGATPGPSERGQQRGWGTVGGQLPSTWSVKQGPCVSKQVDSESHSRAAGLSAGSGGSWAILVVSPGLAPEPLEPPCPHLKVQW